jgi:hypothetical protein
VLPNHPDGWSNRGRLNMGSSFDYAGATPITVQRISDEPTEA